MGQKKIFSLMVLAFAGFIIVLALAGCGGGTGSGVRATAEAMGTTFPDSVQPATPQPFQAVTMVVGTAQTSEVEQVRVEVPVQVPVEVTRIVEVVVTATPDIQGFPAPDADEVYVAPAGIDESLQPCPASFWRGGRCTATQAELDAYAQGGE